MAVCCGQWLCRWLKVAYPLSIIGLTHWQVAPPLPMFRSTGELHRGTAAVGCLTRSPAAGVDDNISQPRFLGCGPAASSSFVRVAMAEACRAKLMGRIGATSVVLQEVVMPSFSPCNLMVDIAICIASGGVVGWPTAAGRDCWPSRKSTLLAAGRHCWHRRV